MAFRAAQQPAVAVLSRLRGLADGHLARALRGLLPAGRRPERVSALSAGLRRAVVARPPPSGCAHVAGTLRVPSSATDLRSVPGVCGLHGLPQHMSRFALLRHESPQGIHWDLLLEAGKTLRTWALPELPAEGVEVVCRALPITGSRISTTRARFPADADRSVRGTTAPISSTATTPRGWQLSSTERNLRGRMLIERVPESPGQWRLRWRAARRGDTGRGYSSAAVFSLYPPSFILLLVLPARNAGNVDCALRAEPFGPG